MYHYLDFDCCDGTEISSGFIMSKLANFLHLQFVDLAKQHSGNPIAIAFPAYREKKIAASDDSVSGPPTIGDQIRLWAVDERVLQELAKQVLLIGLEDYIRIGSVNALDSTPNQFCCFQRRQFKPLNVERLIRRRMKRHNESEAEARSHYDSYSAAASKLPFLNMKSLSTGNRFRLFIEKTVQTTAQTNTEWSFNSYGLGNSAIIPDFLTVTSTC